MAWRNHLNKGESGLGKAVGYGLLRLAHVQHCPAGNVGSSAGSHKLWQVEGWIEVAVGRCGSARSERCGRPHLATSHAIVEIVYTDDGHVDIAASSVNKMVTPDTRQVTISRK